MKLKKLNLILEQSKDAEHIQTLENQLKELTSQLACSKQHLEQRESELSDIREVKHNLEINLETLASEKSSSEQGWQSHMDAEKIRFENIIKEKDLNLETKDKECETLKEKLNSLVENMEKTEKIKEQDISELKEKISNLSVTLTASNCESENKLEITTKELEARSKELEVIKEKLSDVQTRLESLTRESEQKINLIFSRFFKLIGKNIFHSNKYVHIILIAEEKPGNLYCRFLMLTTLSPSAPHSTILNLHTKLKS